MPGECCFEDDGDVEGGVVDEDDEKLNLDDLYDDV